MKFTSNFWGSENYFFHCRSSLFFFFLNVYADDIIFKWAIPLQMYYFLSFNQLQHIVMAYFPQYTIHWTAVSCLTFYSGPGNQWHTDGSKKNHPRLGCIVRMVGSSHSAPREGWIARLKIYRGQWKRQRLRAI